MLNEILQCSEEMTALQDKAEKNIHSVASANQELARSLASAAGKA